MIYFSWIALLFGLTLILTTLSSWLWRGTAVPGDSTNVPARAFLVLLRLAIGWHCFVEGMDKLQNPAWSSEPYLRESVGPMAGFYHRLAGDRLIDKLTVVDGKVSPALRADYDAYLAELWLHYGLDEAQLDRADDVLRQGESKALTWLTAETEEVQKIAPYPPPLKLAMTIPQRLAEYRRLQDKVAEAGQYLPSADKDLQKRYTDAKADANKWRADLKKSYDAQFAAFKRSLLDALTPTFTPEQKALPPFTGPVVPAMTTWGLLQWADLAVEWGLVICGCGLMLGLFSRLCSAGAGLLILSFFLAIPPLPGWPESPRLEGHYLFINKTLIEVLALGALTFLPTGRWAGVDALLYPLWPWNWRRPAPTAAAPARTRVPVAEPEAVQPV